MYDLLIEVPSMQNERALALLAVQMAAQASPPEVPPGLDSTEQLRYACPPSTLDKSAASGGWLWVRTVHDMLSLYPSRQRGSSFWQGPRSKRATKTATAAPRASASPAASHWSAAAA
jgi:hypothetical protein